MSASEHTARIDELAGQDIDWTATIINFGIQHDMSWKESLRWISNRSSLQVACEIFGISLSPSIATRYTKSDIDILTRLGDILYLEGYTVPRLMENHRTKYTGKGQIRVGFTLSKEQYLRERATGKSKNRIAREQGISGPALFHWLHKWTLDAATEQLEIERLVTGDEKLPVTLEQNSVLSNPDRADGKSGDKPNPLSNAEPNLQPSWNPKAPTRHLSTAVAMALPKGESDERIEHISRDHLAVASGAKVPSAWPAIKVIASTDRPETSLPIAPLDDRESIIATIQLSLPIFTKSIAPTSGMVDSNELSISAVAAPSGHQSMQAALQMLQHAVSQAYRDLTEMLGEEAASEQIQHYVDHQVRNYLRVSHGQ